jgi:hypothetical protein
MRGRFVLSMSLAVFLCCPVQAASDPISVHWSELPQHLNTRWKVALALPDGARIQGKVVKVEPDALVVNVTRTDDSGRHPKGRAEIPRASVRQLQILRMGWVWRTVLTPVAVFASLGPVAALAWSARSDAAAVAVLAMPVGAGVGAYYGARRLDRKTRTILVVPD